MPLRRRPRWAGLIWMGLVICGGLPALSGCTGVGPRAIGWDGLDYAQATARSAQREMLLNIVKLRFGDTPTLSTVGQIVAGYSVEGRIDLGTDLIRPEYWFRDDVSVGIGGTFSDRPTITYNPVRGADYARMLLTPLPPYELVAMLTTGAPADATLRLAIKSLNGIAVGPGPEGPRPEGRRNREALELMEELRAAGMLGLEFRGHGDHRQVSLLVDEAEGRLDPRADRLLRLLRLDPAGRRFRIVFGFRQDRPDEISIYTRSLIEILNTVADEIEVPEAAVREGRTYPTRSPLRPADNSLRIESRSSRPEGAFVAVEYDGVWYYVRNDDFMSKRVFGLLMLLAAVMQTSGNSPLPVITIPSG